MLKCIVFFADFFSINLPLKKIISVIEVLYGTPLVQFVILSYSYIATAIFFFHAHVISRYTWVTFIICNLYRYYLSYLIIIITVLFYSFFIFLKCILLPHVLNQNSVLVWCYVELNYLILIEGNSYDVKLMLHH